MARRILGALALTIALLGLGGTASTASVYAQGSYVAPTGTGVTGGAVSTGMLEGYFNQGPGQAVIVVTGERLPSTFMRVEATPADDVALDCTTFGRGC
ncbi:MAG TPA: hypothetical protein VK066_17850 [Chloroflexota bacterium]|nr:hypothetical protein [Chloroflexota bacterium]